MNSGTAMNRLPEKAASPATKRMKELLNHDELTNCMRCGFCLPACPTYRETGREAASPRGRIALMKAVADGHMQAGEQLSEQLDMCLGCRACEPACPSGVQYGELLEQAREAIEDHARHRFPIRLLRKLVFRGLFPYPGRMRLMGRLLAFYQKSGLQKLARLTILKLFPAHLRTMEAVLPPASGKGVAKELGLRIPAQGPGPAIGTVAMFSGCLMDILFLETNKNTVQLLSEAGFDVVIPEGQNCCGALHAHSGEREQARKLARSNVRTFRESGVDFIVSNAGGCGALLKEYHHLLEGEELEEDARWFASRVKDVSELLLDHSPMRDFGSLEERITYQGSCHLQNVMKVKNQPRELIRLIHGAEYVELKESDRCCGSAGIYNLTQPVMASSILDEKMDHVQSTQADTLATSNPGCLLQMKAGLHTAGLSGRMRAVHVADLIAEARRNRAGRTGE